MSRTPPHDHLDAESRAGADLSAQGRRPADEHEGAPHGVLILGDDGEIRDLVRGICAQEGWQATEAAGIEDVRARLGAGTFTVALVTGSHALEIAAELGALREKGLNLSLVVVPMLSHDDQGLHALEGGTCAVLSKPVSEAELRHALRHSIAERYWQQRAERAEDALRAAEERLEGAVRGSTDGLWELRPLTDRPWWEPGAPVWYSTRFREMLGCGDDFPNFLESWTNRVHPEDRDQMFAALRAHIQEREPLDVECRIRTKSGAYRWFRIRGQAQWDEHGTFLHMAGSLQCITDRKLAEVALRQAEERYRNIFEGAVEGIFQVSPEGRFLIVNSSFARMLGYASPSEVVSQVDDVGQQLYVHPERSRELTAMLETQGVVTGFEAEFLRRNGEPVWLSINARAVHDAGSAWRYYEGTAEDVTERKRDADRLARINDCLLRFGNSPNDNIARLTRLCGELLAGDWALYSRLHEGKLHAVGQWRTPPDLATVTDPDGHICSEVLACGGDRAWLARHLPESDFAETDPGIVQYGLQSYLGQAVRRGGGYIGVICVVFCKDFVPSDSDRRLLGIVASAIGVEESRGQADMALHRALHQTRVVLESLPSAILVVREDLTIMSANALASQYFNEGRASLFGRSLAEVLPDGEAKRCRLMFRTAPHAAEQGYWRQDREFVLQQRTFRYRCFPVVLDDRARPHVGLAIWDVTEERQLQDQLVQTEKLASLGTMVSGMAHEVNNPSQAILGLAEIMMDETAPEKIREYAADIAGYAQHIAAVVRDFACYARTSSREGELDVDINERLADAVKMVRRGPHFGYVEVVTNLQPLPPLRARRSEIEQIFVNIIGNAVQAMRGRGRLMLSTCRRGEKMVASISDTGCGMPKAVLNKIFDPFFTTKEPGKGTGLGLSIAYRIVAKYGGKISVESEEGTGTTFLIEFPLGTGEQGGV